VLRSNWALGVLDVPGLEARDCDGPDDRAICPADVLEFVLSGRELNRNVCGRWVEPDDPELPAVGGFIRAHDPPVLEEPSRLPILPVPLGLPTSDGCGKELRTLSPVFGENRYVVEEEGPRENE
jgi:hypothetical protein